MRAISFVLTSCLLIQNAWAQSPDVRESPYPMKRMEWVFNPLWVQLNERYTYHQGVGLTGMYHFHDRVGLYIAAQYNYIAAISPIVGTLIDTFYTEPNSQLTRLMPWSAQAGIEVTLLNGSISWLEARPLHLQLFINGGAGIGSTRVVLKPKYAQNLEYADAGSPWVGALGAGVRIRLFEHFAFRLELKNLFYSSVIQTLNGCNATDLGSLDRAAKSGAELNAAEVSASCQVEKFGAENAKNNVALARFFFVGNEEAILREHLGVYAGLSVLF